ncbi:DUF7524 family protein [Natrialba swarupiae]|uniref:Uncharacterized protein n=1 Tax=Natrialba swarupiae TaxID=2448032 RepID=A0A5D5ANF0_9EURY|nr:hypothetical protein [Natrialba swarupiae]TYT63389.1 hypothetical protein FYC77_02115 [Natrialba swarupiae]
MRDTEITVHVNRGSANTLEADLESLQTHRRISVVLRGHERPAHVHCRLGGDLDRAASIDAPNYYIEPEDVTVVPVAVDSDHLDDPISGELEILTGYGSESLEIDLTIVPSPADVEIDNSLATPDRSPPEPTTIERIAEAFGHGASTAGVLVLGVLALAIAAMTAATIGGLVALVGLGIVAGGVVVALWLLVH